MKKSAVKKLEEILDIDPVVYVVYEFPFRDRAFKTRKEAEQHIMRHKPGKRDLCWIKEEPK